MCHQINSTDRQTTSERHQPVLSRPPTPLLHWNEALLCSLAGPKHCSLSALLLSRNLLFFKLFLPRCDILQAPGPTSLPLHRTDETIHLPAPSRLPDTPPSLQPTQVLAKNQKFWMWKAGLFVSTRAGDTEGLRSTDSLAVPTLAATPQGTYFYCNPCILARNSIGSFLYIF